LKAARDEDLLRDSEMLFQTLNTASSLSCSFTSCST